MIFFETNSKQILGNRLVTFSQTESVLDLIYWWCDCDVDPESRRYHTLQRSMSMNMYLGT